MYQSCDLQLYSQCPEDWANLAAFMQSFFYRVYWPEDAAQEPSFNWISSIAMSPLKLLPLTPSKTSWTQKYEVPVTRWTFFKPVRDPLILRQISNAYILLNLIPFTLVIIIWMLREIKTIVVVAMHVYLKNHSSKINKGYKSKDNDGWRWELNIFLKNSQFASLHFDFDHPLINNRGFFFPFFLVY